jgi:hypothetical protein
MTPNVEISKWQNLAEQASVEIDGEKLSALIERLCAALDGETRKIPLFPPAPPLSSDRITPAA